jgi:(-)-germacrene D synthase
MKRQVRAYHAEAKWFHKKYTPTMEEYMEVALVTSGYSMLTTTSFVGMEDIVTKDSFEWIFSDPKIVKAVSVVCRLMDDIVSHKVRTINRNYVHLSLVELFLKSILTLPNLFGHIV